MTQTESGGNLRCPKCNHATRVLDSRPVGGMSVRRRRRCVHCFSRFTTFEVIATSAPAVVPAIGRWTESIRKLVSGLGELAKEAETIATVIKFTDGLGPKEGL